MTDYRLTRRRLVLGATVALTGCVGSDGGDGSDGESGTRATTTTAEPATSEPTAESSAQAGLCAAWEGPTTSYDTAGTPFFFDYDYVESWTPEEITDYSNGHFVRFTSPAVGDDDTTLTLRVSQFNAGFTAAERDEEIEYFRNFEAEPREVVRTITYDGESLRVLGLVEEEISFYQPGLTVLLPYGSGDDRRYYAVGAVLLGGMGVPEADRPACIAAAEAAQLAVIESLTPNPDTTFEGA